MTKYMKRIFNPVIKNHLIDEIYRLKNDYIKNINDIDNCNLYMNSLTYRELEQEVLLSNKNFGDINIIRSIYGDYGTIFGLDIKIDNDMEPFSFMIRKENNMEREYCKNDVDSLDAYRYFVEGFRGAGKSNKVLTPLPTKYIINEGATILFWSDGTKTIVKRAEDDEYNKVMGFLWAYFQKHSGLSKTKANEYLRSLNDDKDLKVIEMLEKGELTLTLGNIADGISNAFKNIADSFKKNKED